MEMMDNEGGGADYTVNKVAIKFLLSKQMVLLRALHTGDATSLCAGTTTKLHAEGEWKKFFFGIFFSGVGGVTVHF